MAVVKDKQTRKMEIQEVGDGWQNSWPAGVDVATSAQLSEAGLSQKRIATLARNQQIIRLRKGAFVRGDYWSSLMPSGKDNLRLVAHMATVQGKPVYSYFSAARFHGLYVWKGGPRIHVTSRTSKSGTNTAPDTFCHHELLGPAELVQKRLTSGRAIKLTTLERTIVDCARTASFETAVILGDSALRKGANLSTLWDMVNAIPGKRGVRKARRVLQALDALSESVGETRTRLVIAQMDIEQPKSQCEIVVDGFLYRPDFVWEKQRLIVEFDGDTKYFDYKPVPEVLLAERKRERRLMEAGWRFVRFEWKDLENPEAMKRRIRTALAMTREGAA